MPRPTSVVIAGFPGVGKSVLVKSFSLINGIEILDSDSSVYSWLPNPEHPNRVRNPEFPNNYIRHIKVSLERPNTVILVSTHAIVLDALEKNRIKTALVYPGSRTQLEEYVGRYRDRGSPESFIKNIKTNWCVYLNAVASRDAHSFKHFKLQSGEYLSDKFSNIYYSM